VATAPKEPYCEPTDLKLGQIPLPPYMSAEAEIQDAADEIDSKIGYLYKTPIYLPALGRPALLLLKRINSALASGRILLQVAAPEENSSVHSYGASLIREANAAIAAIASGDIVLDGADKLEQAPPEPASVPIISNLDSESNVEAFYNRIANPAVIVSSNTDPDRFVW
jgi:hypothetical protein